MRKSVIVAIFALGYVAGGCKRQGSAKLEGRWRGTHAEGVVAEVQDAANAFASQTEVVARGNLVAVSTPFAQGRPAVYAVDEESKTSIVLHTEGSAIKETFVFSDDATSMTWRVSDGRSIYFTKIKE